MSNNKYEYFEQALTKLEFFLKDFDQSEVQRAGIIQAFEFTFEQCWKYLQKMAQIEGVNVASPKKAFQWAFSANLISTDQEQIWLSMIDERNQTTHTYRDAIAAKVLSNIQSHYAGAFQKLLEKVKAQ